MKRIILCVFLTALPTNALCDDAFTSSVFVDTYSAYAKNSLSNDERLYVTQSIHNQDLHLNLASAGIGYDDKIIRGKLVGQYGDSVDINYNAEPQDSFKFIQESYIGAYLDESTSIDIGTFLAHVGAEGWLSKDNLNYTRSYIAEFSPYYETGMRLSHTFNSNWSGQLLGVNGWQNTSEAKHPALGTQVAYSDGGLSITSNTFLGEENHGNRVFHDLIVNKSLDSGLSLIGSIDVGYQSDSSAHSGVFWGYSLMGRQTLNEILSVNARFESYQDPEGLIVSSATGGDFRAYGTSVGLDAKLGSGLMLRSEIKHLFSPNKIFLDDQDETNNDTIFVISLSFFDEEKF